MGALVSSILQHKSEDRKHIRQHEQNLANFDDTSIAILHDSRKSVRWYHWALYDTRFRIFYATVSAITIGIGLPVLAYFIMFQPSLDPKYGSCLIKSEYKFECLVNGRRIQAESDCLDAMCCFVDDASLPFKCHHSFPPAYQYQAIDIYRTKNPSVPETEIVEMTLSPRFKTEAELTNMGVKLEWVDNGHFTLDFNHKVQRKQGIQEKSQLHEPETQAEEEMGGNEHFGVIYPKKSEYFFVRLRRNNTEETLFDTRLGPVIKNVNSVVFTSAMISPYFFGLKGGQGDGTVTYNVINSPGNMELPFYLSFERSGQCHGVLLETASPFTFQFIKAPGLLFRVEGLRTQAKLHFFPGPTPGKVYAQLHKHLKESSVKKYKTKISELDPLPPYWSLGLHLCRRGYNVTETFNEFINLNGNSSKSTTRLAIPYDTDCIDENLRTPFAINQKKFPINSEEWAGIVNYISQNNKRIILSQKIGLDSTKYEPNSTIPLIRNKDGSPLVGWSEEGISRFKSVNYPDYLDPSSSGWSRKEMELLKLDFGSDFNLVSGLVLVDNFPIAVNSSDTCKQVGVNTNIQSAFYDQHLICHDALHKGAVPHLEVHNSYGAESTRTLRNSFISLLENPNERTITTSVSIWPGETWLAGLQVPFTWNGLRDSLEHIVRNFMMTKFTGTPICGTYIDKASEDNMEENVDDLCLRWFQFGLLLPFARNTHEYGGIRGPLDMSLKYRKYLIGNIRNRYKYNPYYYTQLYEGILNPQPLIRPLIYDFNGQPEDFGESMTILSQFMIGPAVMVAPILSQSPSREAYFPAGIWYDIHGNLVSANEERGIMLTIPSILAEIPMYIRNGYIIPTFRKPLQNTAEETLGGEYALIVTHPIKKSDVSIGSLYVDDGISRNSVSENMFDYLTFEATSENLQIEAQCNSWTDPGISKNISEILLIGFSKPEALIDIETIPPYDGGVSWKHNTVDEDTRSITVTFKPQLNWCEYPNFKLKWVYSQ